MTKGDHEPDLKNSLVTKGQKYPCTQAGAKLPSFCWGEHRGKTSAHAREQKMAKNLNSTFVNKNMTLKNLR